MNLRNPILGRVADFIRQEKLLARGDRVLVACSGGIDSVVLLRILRELPLDLELTIGHINHGLRGRESERDARFVRRIGRDLGLTVLEKKLRPGSGNIQDKARTLRLRQLADWARLLQAKVATGHHADDQTETVLARLLRGTGPTGLTGIMPGRILLGIPFIRPLLATTRSEIRDFARRHRTRWVEDSSNAVDHYERNRLRQKVVPHLEKIRPGLGPRLIRLQKILSLDDDFWEGSVRAALQQVRNGSKVCSVQAYRGFHPALRLRVLRALIGAEKGDLNRISHHHLSKLDELLLSPAPRHSYNLPGGWRFVKDYVVFRFLPT